MLTSLLSQEMSVVPDIDRCWRSVICTYIGVRTPNKYPVVKEKKLYKRKLKEVKISESVHVHYARDSLTFIKSH